MTSKSQRSSPTYPPETSYNLNPPPIIYGSLMQFLAELDNEIKKEKEKEKSKEFKSEKQEFKTIELYEKGSLLDFFSQGLGVRQSKISQQQNPAPLNRPPQNYEISSDIFRQNNQNGQNSIFDFLGKCLPPQPKKPSTHPTQPAIERKRPAIVTR